ncbi:leucine-rich repeat domain-containing protein [Seonamhaeicola sp. NFXS20]|uniref:leucine-rich repeat domain-containing protein n=2 Tax=unclassified Seonamhaeicola TaxID=2622645 RepID=UPI003B8D007C
MKTYIYLVFIVLSVEALKAQTFEVEGINYNILNATDVEVMSKTGCYSGDITIPATVDYATNTYSVTTIGYEAFKNCDITNITLPNSITQIEDYAFRDCREITTITLPNSVTNIGYGAFLYCTILESVNIPDGVTAIDQFTFGSCNALESINIPESVASIGTYAFTNCSSLVTVNSYMVAPINITVHVFWNLDLSSITLNVPPGSESAYAVVAVWQDFKAINGTLSNDKFEAFKELKVYPNPVISELKVVGLNQLEAFKIYNVLGNVVMKSDVVNNESINLEGLVSGLYFLKLKNKTPIKFIKK